MEAQDEYVPLFPLLGNYWDKPLSELPEELQARVSTKEPKLDKTRVIGHAVKKDANGQIVGVKGAIIPSDALLGGLNVHY